MSRTLFVLLLAIAWSDGHAQSSLPPCPDSDVAQWANCVGTHTYGNGIKYEGGFKAGKWHGEGALTWPDGTKHVGGWRNGEAHGQGTLISSYGYTLVEGIWSDNKVVSAGAEWFWLGGGDKAQIFVQPQSIRQDGYFRRAWIMQAFPTPIPQLNWLSSRNLERFDCRHERSQRLSQTTFSGSFGSGSVLDSLGEQDWSYVAPGTTLQTRLQYICDYKLTPKK